MTASFAARPDAGARLVAEPPSAARSAFQRDRDRIIHSTAFRRLALKTQVFLPDQGDHYRTRLTHTIEVAQIARTLTRALGLDDDLAEALALAHDLGHTPFGHTGEDALNDALATFGGFDHNAQTIRIVTLLERRYPRFPGLNLTWDTLEGLVKRGSPHRAAPVEPWHREDLAWFADPAWRESFERMPRAGGEAQAASVADDIAYNAHDLEDGLQAGLFGLDVLDAVPVLRDAKRMILDADPGLDDDLLIRGLARHLVGLFVEDAIAESRSRIATVRPTSIDDIRAQNQDLVTLSDPLAAASDDIKAFLFTHMYRHPRLVALRTRAKDVVSDLTRLFLDEPRRLPGEWLAGCTEPGGPRVARRVADYIAGMTDRFALAEHRRFFDATPELR